MTTVDLFTSAWPCVPWLYHIRQTVTLARTKTVPCVVPGMVCDHWTTWQDSTELRAAWAQQIST